MSKNLSHLSERKGLGDNLFEQLATVNAANQPLSKVEIQAISEEYLIGNSTVFGTMSFYDFTRASNFGKKAYVCNGSACLVAGTQTDLRHHISKIIPSEQIGEMCCLGRCHENHAFHFNGVNYSGNLNGQLDEIFRTGKIIEDHYEVEALSTQILTATQLTAADVKIQLLQILSKSKEDILSEIKASGLRGRGGAGFPISIKLEGCKAVESDKKFIVCNADEGDPGSYSDRYILEHQANSLLLGMMISAYVIGADRGVIYIRAEYPESINCINIAVQELRQNGCLGENILGTGFNFEFKVIKAQGAYICGEETALLSSIEGQRPEVRVRPPFPVVEGLFRRPTVVNNVETLANLPWIIQHGGDKYSAIGTAKSTGTKLISLDSGFNRPGIYEAEMGTSIADVVEKLGKGFKHKVKALHIGGPLGGLVPVSKIKDLTLDFESFAVNGFMLGHASVISIPEEYPMIKYLEHLFEFTAHESCGKCFPCRIGSVRGKEMVKKSQVDPSYKIDTELMNDLLDTMKRGSLCALGGGIPLPVMNAMQYFSEELKIYFK